MPVDDREQSGSGFQKSPTGPWVTPPPAVEPNAVASARTAAAQALSSHPRSIDAHFFADRPRCRHSRLSRCIAAGGLGLLEGPVFLAEPDLVAGGERRLRRLRPWTSGTRHPRQDRPGRGELVSRAARRSPSRAGRCGAAGLARRQSRPGHHHRRNHPLARARHRRRRCRRLGPRARRPIAPAPASSSMPAASRATGSRARCWASIAS